jgi:hypothetical protein
MSADVSRPVTITTVHSALRTVRIRAIQDGKQQASRRSIALHSPLLFGIGHPRLSGITPQKL